MITFEPTSLTADERQLQDEVRTFLDAELPTDGRTPGLGAGADSDPDFSKRLAERGWVGMAMPREYGGGDRTAVERFVVVEELLRRGAPVGYHWVADRQTAPMLKTYGTEAQRQRFLPGICRGEISFSIGMSEPNAGSDLAALRSRATPAEGGWRLNGTKIWTSRAHEADWIVVLCRTSDESDRHGGLSQLIVDLHSPGVAINPIPFLDGSHHFNEVVFDGVFVPDELLLGMPGQGWKQNSSELAYERGGPDRWLSTYLVVEQYLRENPDLVEDVQRLLGTLTARWWSLRQMSLSVARMIDGGLAPAIEASLVKEMGTRFEQGVLAALVDLLDVDVVPEHGSLFERLLGRAILTAPSFTVRGGTIEILRSVVAKGLAP